MGEGECAEAVFNQSAEFDIFRVCNARRGDSAGVTLFLFLASSVETNPHHSRFWNGEGPT
jgi:hypothetical protein